MTFICDVIIRVSIKVSFSHLYVLEVWQKYHFECIASELLFEAFVVSFCGMPVWLITQNSELRFWKTS